MSGFLISGITTVLLFIALATLLHLQFGKTGILNFGVVGFAGIGMYSFGVMTVTYELPYLLALTASTVLVGLIGLVVGWALLDLDAESVLVGTLAFATIVAHLVVTEKWLTNGVAGLGTIPYPFDFGPQTRLYFMLAVSVVTITLLAYAWLVGSSPYGRLLSAIQDNEALAKGLGKETSREKLVFFTVTCAGMGLVGVLYATASQFLVPQMLGASLTFTVWIAVILGGRRRVLGGAVGVLMTVALFDIVVERYLSLPPEYAAQVPNVKLMLYGLLLMVVILFRPSGLLGENRAGSRGAR